MACAHLRAHASCLCLDCFLHHCLCLQGCLLLQQLLLHQELLLPQEGSCGCVQATQGGVGCARQSGRSGSCCCSLLAPLLPVDIRHINDGCHGVLSLQTPV